MDSKLQAEIKHLTVKRPRKVTKTTSLQKNLMDKLKTLNPKGLRVKCKRAMELKNLFFIKWPVEGNAPLKELSLGRYIISYVMLTPGGTPNSETFVHLVLVRILLHKHRKTAAFLLTHFIKCKRSKTPEPKQTRQ